MLKIINFILLTLILYSISVNSMYKRESAKKEQGAYNVSTGSISSSSSITSDSLYKPSLFFNNSIFAGNQNKDDSNGDKSKLCGSGEYYYNLIPDDTKDIDVIILLVNGLVAFLSSANTSFKDYGYNEFIERLYLIVSFISNSVSAKYDGKIMIHICNRFTHAFQLTLYSLRDLFSEDLSMQQKQKIISTLPKNLKRGTECYEDMESLRIFLQKMIVDFIWVGDLDSTTGGSLGIDTEKVIENAKASKITSIKNLESDIASNRSFLNKNKHLVQLGSLRKDSKKYKKNFIASNIVHKVYLDNTEKNTEYLIELFRKTINKRSIEQTPHIAVLASSATDIIDIIATAFDLQKIILLLQKTQSSDIYKHLIALDSQANEQINKLINKTQNPDNTVVFLQLKIKDVLKTIILEQIKLRVSRQILAETIVNILGEESNEMIRKLKTFVQEKTMKQQSDALSLKSSASKYSIGSSSKYSTSDKSEDDLVLFESSELINSIARFLYSVSCSQVSNDRILFFLDLIDKFNLYELADKEGINYEKFDKEQTILQDKKELLTKILLNSGNENIHNKAKILFDTLSENEKINIYNYFNDIGGINKSVP